jgi:LDH2 family malate/lactate/ureidoglycolate dehydrogenase
LTSSTLSRHITRVLQNAHKAPGETRIYVAGEKECEREKQIREQGIPVNLNLRQELQIMRDEMGIPGYEAYF